jgi:long-chain acyl-CoA synthetase
VQIERNSTGNGLKGRQALLLYDIIKRGAEKYPDRTAILYRETSLSYGDLARQVNRLASALGHRGIGPGDSVAVLLPNCPQFTIAYYAVTALGAICVPANPLLKPAELEHIWGDSRAKLAVTAPLLLPNAQETQRSLPGLRTIVSIGERSETPEGVPTWGGLLSEGSEAQICVTDVTENSPAVCIYTSGTTGRPKGALLSHHNLTVNARQITQVLRFDENDNFLCVLPLFHSFGGTVCQNTPLACGARVTILELFHPARVLEAVETHRVTILPGVPAMFGALLQFSADRPYDFSGVRVCVSGGAPMPVAVMEAFERKFRTIIIEGDGPTECSPVTSVNPLEGVRKPGSIGLPIPGVEMKIFDDRNNELPPNEIGEIVVRGENVMLGYLNQPEATAEAMTGGWYHTGDLGKADEDGYFYIVDRKKDMLIVGGLNVYPREIEEVLYTHPAVADAAVIGAADALRGEEVVAVVTLKPGAQTTDRELIRYCRQRLANYKVPRKIVFRDDLPRGGTGKVLKRLLRKEMDLE